MPRRACSRSPASPPSPPSPLVSPPPLSAAVEAPDPFELPLPPWSPPHPASNSRITVHVASQGMGGRYHRVPWGRSHKRGYSACSGGAASIRGVARGFMLRVPGQMNFSYAVRRIGCLAVISLLGAGLALAPAALADGPISSGS